MIRSSSIIKAFNDPFEGVYLNHTGQQVNLMFSLYVNDGEFDNDDNPYGRWVLHRYTNMNDIHDENKENYEKGYRDEHIQLEPCQLSSEFDWTSSGVKVYCPAMTSFDFLYGNFYTKWFSWARLALHFCNNSTEAIEERLYNGKKFVYCESEQSSKAYFSQKIVGLDILSD